MCGLCLFFYYYYFFKSILGSFFIIVRRETDVPFSFVSARKNGNSNARLFFKSYKPSSSDPE